MITVTTQPGMLRRARGGRGECGCQGAVLQGPDPGWGGVGAPEGRAGEEAHGNVERQGALGAGGAALGMGNRGALRLCGGWGRGNLAWASKAGVGLGRLLFGHGRKISQG